MSRFLQLCLIFFAAAAAIVSDTSADEAAISDDYFYDYDLYSYDDIIDALYSDEGEKTINRYCFDQTSDTGAFFFQPRSFCPPRAGRGRRGEKRGQKDRSDRSNRSLRKQTKR